MKQYLTQEQTAKLVELGFEKPKSYHDIEWDGMEAYDYQIAYSIGELIEMLPTYIERIDGILIDALLNIGYDFFKHCWVVAYIDDDEYKYRTSGSELIDALYDMVCKLKESGYARG